jgi:hypothetical protein
MTAVIGFGRQFAFILVRFHTMNADTGQNDDQPLLNYEGGKNDDQQNKESQGNSNMTTKSSYYAHSYSLLSINLLILYFFISEMLG